jgi:hypothetical protein
MTRKELSQLYYLNRDIQKEKDKLFALESAATSITSKITGLPHVGGISDKTSIAAEISDTKDIIEAKIKQSVIEYNRLNRYICGIDDSLTRQILQYRFINGLEWNEVANCIGGNMNENCAKKICSRYLRSH